MPVKAQPDGYHTLTPYLIAKDASGAIDFYKKVFGAQELFRLSGPDGKIGHAELKIGDSVVMIADEHPGMGALSPQTIGGTPVRMLIYVENVENKLAGQVVRDRPGLQAVLGEEVVPPLAIVVVVEEIGRAHV